MPEDKEDQDDQDQRDADHDETDEPTKDTDELGDKGKAALSKERDARKAAEKERDDFAKKIAAFEEAQKKRDDAAAKEKGDWEKLATDRETEVATLKAQLAERDLTDRKTAIAKAAGLPDEIVGRLRGETDEELEEDAKALAKLLKAKDAPDNDAGDRTKPGTKKPDKSEFAKPSRWGLR